MRIFHDSLFACVFGECVLHRKEAGFDCVISSIYYLDSVSTVTDLVSRVYHLVYNSIIEGLQNRPTRIR